MEAVWKKVKSAIKQRIPDHSFKMWLEPLSVSQADKTNWVVYCPNFFSKKRVQGLYGEMIRNAIQQSTDRDCELKFEISSKAGTTNHTNGGIAQRQLPTENARPNSGNFLRRDFTFDRFVVGDNSDFAYSASY